MLSGQELIYRGRFGAAQLYFARLSQSYPLQPVGPVLAASAMIWWGEARGDETWSADSIDGLLAEAIGRARTAADSAVTDSARTVALFWLGTAYGYRARQAELRGSLWRAARDARAMRLALEEALALDSSCSDCLLGLGIVDYALARSSALARLVARLVGVGGGDAERGLARLRRAAETGLYARWEARWVYANALVREGEREPALREEGRRLLGDLAVQFPDNPVFRQALSPAPAEP